MILQQLILKNKRIGLFALFLLVLFIPASAEAASLTLAWDPNDSVTEGYRVFARKSDQVYNYSQPEWEGTATTCTLYNLEDQTEYYFVARAYDGDTESADSGEVHYIPPVSTDPNPDMAPPSWNGSTTGIGLAVDTTLGGSVTVEFDTAYDVIEGNNLKFNVYYAPSKSWDNANWSRNGVIVDATVRAGSTFSNAFTVSGLTNDISYTFGVRSEDQSSNEDSNDRTLSATPTLYQDDSAYYLMVSDSPNRSGAVILEDAGVEGNIYVFVEPITEIKTVEFFIDGLLHKSEKSAPYDLAGGNKKLAKPYDTSKLSSGYHAIRAQITKTDGSSETISADMHVY